MNKRFFAAALCLVFLTGCQPQGDVLSDVSSEIHSTASITSEVRADSGVTEVTDERTEPVEITLEAVSRDTSAASVEQQEHSDEASREVTSDGVSAEPASEAVTVTTTTAATVQTTTTVVTTAAPEPVNVVIPEVRVPLSPGKDIAENDKVSVDYSNAADGYISVCWKETGKRVKLRVMSGGSTYDHDVPQGGVTEYYPLSCGSGSYTVQVYEQTDGDRYAKVLEQEFTADIKSATIPFLYPNRYVKYGQDSAVVEKAAVLCAGKSGTIEKVAAVFQWITDNVTYDRELAATVKSGYVPDPDSVLKKKSGICYDYASLMASMLRSQDIPTRLVVGYAKENIYHAWNEIWTEQTGWITPELLLSKSGYNIADATFYAGSADKAKIAEYISDSSNYSALYYY